MTGLISKEERQVAKVCGMDALIAMMPCVEGIHGARDGARVF